MKGKNRQKKLEVKEILFARIRHWKIGGAIVFLPKAVIEDKKYTFKDGDVLKVRIVRGTMVLSIPEWWEMLDWRKVPDAFEKLPKRAKRVIRQEGLF